MEKEQTRKMVREGYAKIARESDCGCGCGCGPVRTVKKAGEQIGYSEKEMDSVPDGANLGLGCGNPTALASLKEGEVVLDLGSGAGFDCFLSANRVGEAGWVIGVDMTPDMLEKARENARKGGYRNVEFRLGEIENLPVADEEVDVIISNCVINLSPDKERVFQEAYRALRPGGRLMVSDIVLLKELPDFVMDSVCAYVGCVAGASRKEDYLKLMREAGFNKVTVVEERPYSLDYLLEDPEVAGLVKKLNLPAETLKSLSGAVLSVRVSAVKPSG